MRFFTRRSAARVLGLSCAALVACSTPPAGMDVPVAPDVETGADAGDDLTLIDAPDPHGGLLLPRCEDTEPAGAVDLPPVASTLVGTIAPMATRVADPESLNPSTEAGEQAYRARGFDRYARGPGEPRVTRAELGAPAGPAATRHSLAYFVHLSDFQLVDDESPARLARLDIPALSGAMRPHEAYLSRAVAAMNRTLAASMRPARPYLFGVVTGDCADSAQLNELRWVIQVMNGERGVHTDSGTNDDPIAGPDNDPKDPFDSVAFPAPWLYVPGNHDVEIVGVTAITDPAVRARAVGTMPMNGTRDYRRWYAPVVQSAVPADPDRRILDRAEIVSELRGGAATPGPVGHGYPADPDLTLGANYVRDVVPGLLRLIAIDTNDVTGGSPGVVHRALVDQWLRPELERAQTDGVLVVLASHHPTTAIDPREGELGDPMPDALQGTEVAQIVAAYPNVIAWLVGHEHDNRVRAIAGADAAHPGYWEIETGAMSDYPSQSRVIELVDNGNGTLSILGTMVDFDTRSCMERRFRRLSLVDFNAAWEASHRGTPGDRNVELVVRIPPTAQARVAAASANAPTVIESDTALAGMR